ncbi:unnamed protein product [Diabrotica balteata]|uniref:Uncharacterized protein n=1 Tax=Diabrotica balteata TaxID=107213 RepID=A0A9N9SKT3_DIABA|nr:unnamed protein product [Diabrotica balteata]
MLLPSTDGNFTNIDCRKLSRMDIIDNLYARMIRTAGVKGSVKINGKPRDMRIFTKLSSYIMQEDLVQPRLSVRESMMVAANLKLSASIGHSQKVAVVDEVIQLLGLENVTIPKLNTFPVDKEND